MNRNIFLVLVLIMVVAVIYLIMKYRIEKYQNNLLMAAPIKILKTDFLNFPIEG